MMVLRASASLAFTAFFTFPILAQTSGQLSDFPDQLPQFIYLYEEVEALTGYREFFDIITVDDKGGFTLPIWPTKGERVVVLESPPWLWRAVINPKSSDKLLLHHPQNGPTKIRGMPARYSYSSDESALSVYEEFKKRVDELYYLSAYDRMAQSGAVGGATMLVNNKYLDSLDSVFQAEFTSVIEQELIANSLYYTDLVMALNWKWRRESGEQSADLRGSWASQGGMENGRSLYELLKSPGWVQSWAEVHFDWFEDDRQELNIFVTEGNVEAIAKRLGCSTEQAQLAMWWWDLNAPSQMSSGWWVRFHSTEIGKIKSRSSDILFTSKNFLDQRWTTPSTDIVYVDELYGKWTAILVVKHESIASQRELGAFRSISKTIGIKRNDIRFVILCIDGDEENWQNVLRSRENTSEIVRWVGTDARWMNGLDINSVPQVVVVTPALDIYNYAATLPSLGLRKYLEILPK